MPLEERHCRRLVAEGEHMYAERLELGGTGGLLLLLEHLRDVLRE